MARVIDIDAILNQPPKQRYSGPEAIARRDELLIERVITRVTDRKPQTATTRDVELTNKDLGT